MARPKKEVKPQQFSVRLHADDMNALAELATLYGTSLSGAVERCVRDAWKAMPAEHRRALTLIHKARSKA